MDKKIEIYGSRGFNCFMLMGTGDLRENGSIENCDAVLGDVRDGSEDAIEDSDRHYEAIESAVACGESEVRCGDVTYQWDIWEPQEITSPEGAL